MERLAMARMGFLDKAREVEVWRPPNNTDIGDRGKELHSTETDEEKPRAVTLHDLLCFRPHRLRCRAVPCPESLRSTYIMHVI